ncbi:MAG: biotin carboxylase [Gammaproteobacteria bacterium]|nr:biotin carboxylase [Gammaproteobacteria bacterium]NND40157.1 biotin carboxylase [Pseudomonadales bacterium]NNM12394.1 biotin carboxylase [Pseudomonadales bacterium]RZV51122.1 MAG: biotin carboxylase [Pseudomonadales bacterium]
MKEHPTLQAFQALRAKSLDEQRRTAAKKRHARGYRSARENLDDLCDSGSFQEYGQLAVAAQRERRDIEELREHTAADGVITGTALINADRFDAAACRTAVIVNDYSVLAGSQGFFHHQKIDRIVELASEHHLPSVMYTEGGGGRPGDVDVKTQIAGLNINTFASWAALGERAPRIAVNNGFCFAGNAALFGAADVRIATRNSWIGMAGPAMIEGGGLGQFKPTNIGPIETQLHNGTVHLLAEDEAHATALARHVLSYFQGRLPGFQFAKQAALRTIMPEDRRFSYKVRDVLEIIFDNDSLLELRYSFGKPMLTALARIGGKPVGVLANDTRQLGGAIDAEAADKACDFLQLCSGFDLPVVSFCDTPGFMVGPDSESQAAVRRMSRAFAVGATLRTPLVCIFLRKGYGLGAMAMAGGSFKVPVYSASWPTGEFGGMGLEGAVQLGFRKELEACASDSERDELFNTLVEQAYERGKATEAASFLEIDAVIDPADTRDVILRALLAAQR